MNPMTNVKNIQKLNETELALGNIGKKSWHDQYKDSAWIFIGGLPYDLTEGDVLCVFSQYGEIVNINLVRDNKTGKSKGFAFICYEDQRSTILAVDNLNSIKILGRTLRVDHVENYKPPKDYGDEDDLTKKLRLEGCAPTPTAAPIIENSVSVDIKEKKKERNSSEKKKKKKEKKKDKKRKHKDSSSGSDESSEIRSDHKHKKKIKKEKLDDIGKSARAETLEKRSSESSSRLRDSSCGYDSDRKNREKYQRESYDKSNVEDRSTINKDRGTYKDEHKSRDMGRNVERSSDRDEVRSRDRHRNSSRERQRSRDINGDYKRKSDGDRRDRYDRDRR